MSRRRIRLGWVVYVYVCSFYGVRNWKNKYNRPTLISSQLVDSLLEESKRPSYMTSHNQSVATENELYQGRNPLTPDQPQEDFLCESPRQNKNVLLPSTISNNISNIDDIATNFLWMSTLFAANHGCVVACLSLATARLGGAVGAWQSGLLYVPP